MTISSMPMDSMVGQNKGVNIRVDEFPTPVGTVKRVSVNSSCLYYCYSNRGNFLYERLVGTGSVEDMAIYYGTVIADENRNSGVRILIDHRWALIEVSFNKLFELNRFIKGAYDDHGKRPSVLVMLSHSDRSYGKTRMYESLADGCRKDVHTVRDVGQALDLLEIDPELLADVMAEIEKIVPAE